MVMLHAKVPIKSNFGLSAFRSSFLNCVEIVIGFGFLVSLAGVLHGLHARADNKGESQQTRKPNAIDCTLDACATNSDGMSGTLDERLRNAICSERRRMGYSQEYMAGQLGMSGQRQYSRYESGGAKLDLGKLEAILEVLNIPIGKLLLVAGDLDPEFGQTIQTVLQERIQHLEAEVLYLREKLDRKA